MDELEKIKRNVSSYAAKISSELIFASVNVTIFICVSVYFAGDYILMTSEHKTMALFAIAAGSAAAAIMSIRKLIMLMRNPMGD